MKTLALSNGDLVVGQNGHATVSGPAKVQQELALALGEPWGTDRFHADVWGSTVTDYIGEALDQNLEFEVRSEVSRVVSQYISIQDQEIFSDFVSGSRSRYFADDVVRGVSSIDVRATTTTLFISVALITQSGQTIELNRTVTI